MLPGSLTPADFKEAFAKNCNGVAKSKYSRMGKGPRKVGVDGYLPSTLCPGFPFPQLRSLPTNKCLRAHLERENIPVLPVETKTRPL